MVRHNVGNENKTGTLPLGTPRLRALTEHNLPYTVGTVSAIDRSVRTSRASPSPGALIFTNRPGPTLDNDVVQTFRTDNY